MANYETGKSGSGTAQNHGQDELKVCEERVLEESININKRADGHGQLGSGLLQVGDEVVSVLGLFKSTKGHLGARNVLFGVLEVVKEGVLVPCDALLLVGLGVGVAGGLARLAAKNAVEVGADLVGAAGLDGVALEAAGLEQACALLCVSWGVSEGLEN